MKNTWIMLRAEAVPLLCLASPLFIPPLIPIVIIYWCVLTSWDPSEFQGTWSLAVYGSHCHRSAPPISRWVSSRIFHWALSSHFKRPLDFHSGISAVKWCTLKIACTSTSKCYLCLCSCLCAIQPPVRQGGSQEQGEQAVGYRPSLIPL